MFDSNGHELSVLAVFLAISFLHMCVSLVFYCLILVCILCMIVSLNLSLNFHEIEAVLKVNS